MAEDMGNAAGIYCGKDWWDQSRSMAFMSNSLSPFCSTGMLDDECFLDFNQSKYCSGIYTKSRSCKESSLDSPARVSGSHELNITTADYPIMGPLLSSIWNYGSGETVDENSTVSTIVFQEELGSSHIENWSEKGLPSNRISVDSTTNAFKRINQEQSNNLDQSGAARCTTLPFGNSPSILQCKMNPQEIITGNHSPVMNLKSSHFNQFTGFPILSNVFCDRFWSFQSNPSPSQVDAHSIRGHVACRKDLILKLSKEYIGDSMSALSEGEYEPAYKRARIETTLPTFKVRKDKLGDRVTALQQLVSPFGKTDTASVLHEAVECIKFLHDQIITIVNMQKGRNGFSVHSKPQMTTEAKDGEDPKQVLRSQGLCLVNISGMSADAPDLLGGTF